MPIVVRLNLKRGLDYSEVLSLEISFWTEPSEVIKRSVVNYVLWRKDLQWLRVEKIVVCIKCRKIEILGSTFLKGFETRIIDLRELANPAINKTKQEEKQEFIVINPQQNVIVPDA
jgi:hypothetical protein